MFAAGRSSGLLMRFQSHGAVGHNKVEETLRPRRGRRPSEERAVRDRTHPYAAPLHGDLAGLPPVVMMMDRTRPRSALWRRPTRAATRSAPHMTAPAAGARTTTGAWGNQ